MSEMQPGRFLFVEVPKKVFNFVKTGGVLSRLPGKYSQAELDAMQKNFELATQNSGKTKEIVTDSIKKGLDKLGLNYDYTSPTVTEGLGSSTGSTILSTVPETTTQTLNNTAGVTGGILSNLSPTMKYGIGALAAAGLIGGGIALKKHLDKKKQANYAMA